MSDGRQSPGRPMARERCPECEAELMPEDRECPECGHPVGAGRVRLREKRERRYVYGKRKHGMSSEVMWLLVFVGLGLVIVLLGQLIAYLRTRNLVQDVTRQYVCRVLEPTASPPPPLARDAPQPAPRATAAARPCARPLTCEFMVWHAPFDTGGSPT